MNAPHKEALVEVSGLQKHFPVRKGIFARITGAVRAVDGVSFTLRRGETLGLVGESGCGKTTAGRCLLRLIEPTGGRIYMDGKELSALRAQELRKARREMQMIFQDPYGSLNPRMTVYAMLREILRVHRIVPPSEVRGRIEELLELVGFSIEVADRYPHEFSGGQRQRLGIARALAVDPSLIVADEPVSALDVSIQSQILNLMVRLQDELNLTYLFISHDLSVVRHVCDRVAVMYLGRIVESAPTAELFARPVHPYTEALLAAVPVADPNRERKHIVLRGDVPSPIDPPSGCPFHPRCPVAQPECTQQDQVLTEVSPGHTAACGVRIHPASSSAAKNSSVRQ